MNFNKMIFLISVPFLLLAYNNCAPALHSMKDGDSLTSENPIIPPQDIEADEFFALGKSQYEQSCAKCHGSLALSSVRNTNLDQFHNAERNVTTMRLALNGLSINKEAIVYALNYSQTSPITAPNQVIPDAQKFTCELQNNRGLNHFPMRRLTRLELENTIADIFGESVLDEVSAFMGLYPEDKIDESFGEFDPSLNSQKVFALFEIANAVAQAASTAGANRRKILPSCAINQFGNINFDNPQCVEQFVGDLGLKMFRRPLTTEQMVLFKSILTTPHDFHQFNRDKTESLIAAMMLSPEFTHHLPVIENQNGGKGRVDSYTVATRLSYSISGSLPDGTLFTSAKNNQLSTLEQRHSHARRLIHTASGRNYILSTFERFLHLDKESPSLSDTYANYTQIDKANLYQELKAEALNFVDHHVFSTQASFADIMTSSKAFPINSNSAKVFGSQVSVGPNSPSHSVRGHRGLFMRPAVLLSSGARTSPIARGIHFAKNVLCTEIPEPDPELIAAAEESLGQLDELLTTTRQQAAHITSPQECQVCHKHINPPGFFFEKFGPFGEGRTFEAVFDGNGNKIRELSIDTQVNDLIIDNQTRNLASSSEFIAEVAQSTQGMACFTENIFKQLNLREYNQNDSCQLSEMEKLVREGQSIQEILIRNAISEDQLWEKVN